MNGLSLVLSGFPADSGAYDAPATPHAKRDLADRWVSHRQILAKPGSPWNESTVRTGPRGDLTILSSST
jgi:hypothetical protein